MKLGLPVVATYVLFLTALFAVSVLAGPWKGWRGSEGWGPDGSYQRMYNPTTLEAVSGEVTGIEQMAGKGMSPGIHLQIKTNRETIPVHLGPAWYLDRLDTRIQTGHRVEVKGSRITYSDKPAIIATEVRKGEEVLKLRDQNGFPAWVGWRL